KLLKLSWRSAHDLMRVAVRRGLEERDMDNIAHVGIDEKSFGKGQDYVSVLVDLDEHRVLEVAEGRTGESAKTLWNTLSDEQKDNVEAVAMDMWPAFISSASAHVPEAEIVHDRFHIRTHLSEAVDQVRRAEHKALKQEGDERLTGSRFLWLTNEENLSEEKAATFEELKNAKLKTARAWAISDLFRDFWDQPGQYTARNFFESWHRWASRSRLEPIIKVGRMIKKHLDNIVTWFRHPISNGAVEGFNSRIQAIKSAARGFRNFENYRIRIVSLGGNLDQDAETPCP